MVSFCWFWSEELTKVPFHLQYRQGREPQEAGGEEEAAQEGPGPHLHRQGGGQGRWYYRTWPFLGPGQEVCKVNHVRGMGLFGSSLKKKIHGFVLARFVVPRWAESGCICFGALANGDLLDGPFGEALDCYLFWGVCACVSMNFGTTLSDLGTLKEPCIPCGRGEPNHQIGLNSKPSNWILENTKENGPPSQRVLHAAILN